jgi:hypothetical protein
LKPIGIALHLSFYLVPFSLLLSPISLPPSFPLSISLSPSLPRSPLLSPILLLLLLLLLLLFLEFLLLALSFFCRVPDHHRLLRSASYPSSPPSLWRTWNPPPSHAAHHPRRAGQRHLLASESALIPGCNLPPGDGLEPTDALAPVLRYPSRLCSPPPCPSHFPLPPSQLHSSDPSSELPSSESPPGLPAFASLPPRPPSCRGARGGGSTLGNFRTVRLVVSLSPAVRLSRNHRGRSRISDYRLGT